ncbi:sensor histidine kinase [Bacillus sp. FJAT-42315]|uniref:sensor histidine kinase n=1 Tax=Bacillus sp. FJAT-42315 TaxID=2014077 RepID=UPI000C245237|nr:HAMP domain-containing sensor histidine kinase [Bacillus sp. FJAT-42315]
MKFNIKIAVIISVFSASMLFVITCILLYKGHEHLMMMNLADSSNVIHHFDMALRETALWAFFVLLLVIIISSFLIARELTKPIHIMNEFALHLVQGKRHLQMNYKVDDSIGQLSRSLTTLDQTLALYEKRRKEMTQELAHEIRNPLATIKSHLSAFEDGIWMPTPERIHECVEEIDRLTKLVDELDTLHDIDSPVFEVCLEKQPIAPLIEQSVLSLASELLEKEIEITLDLNKELMAEVDGLRMRQILHNILKNALHNTPANGWIQVRLQKVVSSLIIAIEDNGIGMDIETQDKIFERYFRQHGRYSGRGLGMTITQKLVAAHGGTITVQSEENKGTTFSIELPLST